MTSLTDSNLKGIAVKLLCDHPPFDKITEIERAILNPHEHEHRIQGWSRNSDHINVLEMTLKKMTYAMLLSGVLLASASAAAEISFTAGSDAVGYTARTPDRDNSPFPIESTPVDYGVRIVRTDSDNPFPDQSDSYDYGIRITRADIDNPFPDQSDSNDYGIRVTV